MEPMTLCDGLWLILRGLGNTVVITVLSLFLGTVLGQGVYAMTMSRLKWVRTVARWWKVIVRGTPMLVLLLVIFNVLLGGRHGVLAAVAAFSINFSNFSSSLIQSAVDSVGEGQLEAGRAMGFARWQISRYVVAPQAISNAMPTFRYQAATILKGTSIVGYVAILDLTKAAEYISGGLMGNLLPLLVSTAIYFVLAWMMNKGLDWVLYKVAKV